MTPAAIQILAVMMAAATPPPADIEAPGEAVEIALGCVCKGDDQCKEDRREDVAHVVADLLWVADEAGVPDPMRPFLVAVACGEGGFRTRPTCGAPLEDVRACAGDERTASDTEWQRCIRAHGGRARCNDSGTSVGMFQMKRRGGLAQQHLRDHGEPVDPLDHVSTGAFYLERLVVGAERTVPSRCGRVPDPWNVAAYRIGRGPVAARGVPAQTVCVPDPRARATVCQWVPAVPAVQRCHAGSRYAAWAQAWHRRAPHAWAPVRREARQ